MGNYNPDAPRILGQQWVPIRNEDTVFSPAVDIVEQGHGFTLATSRTLQDTRYYVNTQPPGNIWSSSVGQTYFAAIYPAGREALSGPVQRAIVPCSFAAITGSAITANANVALSLANSDDAEEVTATPSNSGNSNALDMYFNMAAYPQLNGKRILALNLLYSMAWERPQSGVPGSVADFNVVYNTPQAVELRTGIGSVATAVSYAPLVGTYGTNLLVGLDPVEGQTVDVTQLQRLHFGEVNFLWNGPAASFTSEFLPWRYTELLKFAESAGTGRYWVHFEFGGVSSGIWAGIYRLGYAAMEVVYCEENRVAYGGRGPEPIAPIGSAGEGYTLGVNIIKLRDLSQNLNPTLAAGDYTVAISSADVGDLPGPFSVNDTTRRVKDLTYPSLNALRETYAMPSHPGVQVTLTQEPGDTFSKQTIHTLPQISVHTSGGPLTEVHVYGRQAKAQVYGSITATQEILDSAAGGAGSYPQVRFFARRFGDTTVSLTLSSPTITGTGTTVSITPTDFDALDEIIDGWKQVDLRFTGTVTMGAGTTPQWIWSATGELTGNRWEVLGAIAPAISGVPGNTQNLAPSSQQLSSATYGQPSSGATVNLGWIPQYAPPVTATTDDQTADAVLMFSQDMPTVTGFLLTSASQTVTGIGLNCGINPSFIPNMITYNRITWATTSSGIPVSGFGYYELQRLDTLTDWQTIMKATSPTVSGFNDFEARVGLSTSYRIRAVNSYSFAGAWSSTITGTITAPGIVGTDMGVDDHVMIFTSNSRQNGSRNLAYSMAWESQPNEAFTFPEAGFTQLQTMYNRDFFVAFRPTERGGEQFQRTILVQAAAISPETLADFTSLRDMAWDSLPYVCIRDEDGNRWFASVQVPSARVLRDRKLYLADIGVVEVTSTAAPVTVAS
jgi:hypothetical protein